MKPKLLKRFSVIKRDEGSDTWDILDEYDTKAEAEEYLLEYSVDDGWINVDLKVEVYYRWEVKD